MILGFNCFYSLFRLGSPPDVGGVRIAHHFSFLWCMFYYVVFVIVVVFTQCFQSLWIVHYWLHVRVSLTLITCNIPMFLLCPYILSLSSIPNYHQPDHWFSSLDSWAWFSSLVCRFLDPPRIDNLCFIYMY
jgi:hypothetical protein